MRKIRQFCGRFPPKIIGEVHAYESRLQMLNYCLQLEFHLTSSAFCVLHNFFNFVHFLLKRDDIAWTHVVGLLYISILYFKVIKLTSKGIGDPTSEAIDGASLSVSAWLISSTSTSSPSLWAPFSSPAAATSASGFAPRSCDVLLRLLSLPPGEGLCPDPLVEDVPFFFFFFVPVPDFFFWNILSWKGIKIQDA